MNSKTNFYVELVNPNNWKANISHISRKTGLPTSTVYSKIKRLQKRTLVSIRMLNELELEESQERIGEIQATRAIDKLLTKIKEKEADKHEQLQ